MRGRIPDELVAHQSSVGQAPRIEAKSIAEVFFLHYS